MFVRHSNSHKRQRTIGQDDAQPLPSPAHHPTAISDKNQAAGGHSMSAISVSHTGNPLYPGPNSVHAQSRATVPYRPIHQGNDRVMHAISTYPRGGHTANFNGSSVNQSVDPYPTHFPIVAPEGPGVNLPSLVNPNLSLPALRQPYMMQVPPAHQEFQRTRNYEAPSPPIYMFDPQKSFNGIFPSQYGQEYRPPLPVFPSIPQKQRFAASAVGQPAAPLRYDIGYSSLGSSTKVSQETEKVFDKLVPLINNINAYNFGELLVDVLKSCPQHVSLDDFYNLLYNSPSPSDSGQCSKPGSIESETEGLELCRAVVEVFKKAENPVFRPQIKQNSSLSSINFHELLRTFLAIKIIFDSLEEVTDSSSSKATLPRLSIYKAYYVICQNLIHKHPTDTNTSSLQQKLILGQSRLGKLTKLVYPNLIAKRLGKRGQSKYNYLGLRWNSSVVNREILGMIELDINQLRDHFQPSRERGDHEHRSFHSSKPSGWEDMRIQRLPPSSSSSMGIHATNKPMYSYIDVTLTYPQADCSPRVWKTSRGARPELSAQAKQALDASLKVLESHQIDLGPLIKNFNKGLFFEDSHSSLSKTVIRALDVLSRASSESVHLHLYLAVFLLAFPSVLASDQEITFVTKTQLRASLKSCITSLENFTSHNEGIDIGLSNFTKILEKMIHLNEMTSSSINDMHVDSVTKVIVRDLGSIENSKPDTLGGKFTMEEIFIRGIVTSINAYKFKLFSQGSTSDAAETVGIISIIAKTFVKAVLSVRDALSLSSVSLENDGFVHDTHDLPYKVFKLSAMAFHEICLAEPFILQLPIPVITYIVLNITNEMQNVSFHDFGNRDPGLSKDTFKTWWVFSTTFQEYMSIISEIIALTQRLA